MKLNVKQLKTKTLEQMLQGTEGKKRNKIQQELDKRKVVIGFTQ